MIRVIRPKSIRVIRARRGWILVITSMRSKLEMRTRITTRFSHVTTKGLFRVSGFGFRVSGLGFRNEDEESRVLRALREVRLKDRLEFQGT